MAEDTNYYQAQHIKQRMPNFKIDFNDREDKNSESYHSHTSVRVENSNTLGSLTKKFVQLIQNAPNKTIQIHQASQILCIQKRRIYDITNVLQGIGYIQKLGKNQMRWVGGDDGQQLQKDAYELQKKMQDLDISTKRIQEQIQIIKQHLIEQSKKINYNFFTLQDITYIMKQRQISKMLVYSGCLGDQMEVDSNPETKISQCTISSNTKHAKLYLCTLSDQKLSILKEEDENFAKMNDFHFLSKQRHILDGPQLIINGSIYELDQSYSFQQKSL